MDRISENLIKERLTDAIRNSGTPYKNIAEMLNVSHSLISQYCNSAKMPRLDTFANLCKILDVSPNYILGFNDHE